MSDDLTRLENWVAPLLAKLSASEVRKLNNQIARELRRSQQQRIRKQQNPDGTPFAQRKQAKPAKPKNKPKRFIYNGKERLVVSYQNHNGAFTGFDRSSGKIKTFHSDRVEKWLPPPAGAVGGWRYHALQVRQD